MNTDSNFIHCSTCDRFSEEEALYAQMILIREFETSLLNMFEKGLLAGTTHTCLGQEATAVGVIAVLDKGKDIVFSNHRGHGHFISYCGEIERLYLEIMGKPEGVCAGRGGSQHLHYKNFYTNGVQGGIVPVSAGMALAEKEKKSGAIVCVFLGDGTLGEGVVYETLNISSLWNLPIIFIIENNGYAQSTPFQLQVAGSIEKRPEAFGIQTKEIDSTSVFKIREETSKVVDEVRLQGKPYCIRLNSVRLGPHSKGDDSRNKRQLDESEAKDPMNKIDEKLSSMVLDKINKKSRSIIEKAVKSAIKRKKY